MSSCTHPITAWWNPSKNEKLRFKLPLPDELENFEKIPVACLRCEKCQAAYARDWAVRSVMEIYTHEQSTFITLTYEEVDVVPTLKPEHMTNFMKRLRTYIHKNNNGKKIRYLQCGEYGDKYHRPHHHALIFGYDFPDLEYKGKSDKGESLYTSKILEELWGHGRCDVGEANIKTALYVSGYIGKKIYGSKDADGLYLSGGSKNTHYNKTDKETGEIHTIHKEYMTMSRMPGLGHSFYEKYTTDMFPSGKLHFHDAARNVSTYPVPSYFYRKLAETNPKLYLQSMKIKHDAAIAYQQEQPQEITPERLRVKAQILRKSKVEKGRPLDGINPSYHVNMSDIDEKQKADKRYQQRLKEQEEFEKQNTHKLQSKSS
jgi:hypothetical protein